MKLFIFAALLACVCCANLGFGPGDHFDGWQPMTAEMRKYHSYTTPFTLHVSPIDNDLLMEAERHFANSDEDSFLRVHDEIKSRSRVHERALNSTTSAGAKVARFLEAVKGKATRVGEVEVVSEIPTPAPAIKVHLSFKGELSTNAEKTEVKGRISIGVVFKAGPLKLTVFVRGIVELSGPYPTAGALIKQAVLYLVGREDTNIQNMRKQAVVAFNEYVKEQTKLIKTDNIKPGARALGNEFRTKYAPLVREALGYTTNSKPASALPLIEAITADSSSFDPGMFSFTKHYFQLSTIEASSKVAFAQVNNILEKAFAKFGISMDSITDVQKEVIQNAKAKTEVKKAAATQAFAEILSTKVNLAMKEVKSVAKDLEEHYVNVAKRRSEEGLKLMYQVRYLECESTTEYKSEFDLHIQTKDKKGKWVTPSGSTAGDIILPAMVSDKEIAKFRKETQRNGVSEETGGLSDIVVENITPRRTTLKNKYLVPSDQAAREFRISLTMLEGIDKDNWAHGFFDLNRVAPLNDRTTTSVCRQRKTSRTNVVIVCTVPLQRPGETKKWGTAEVWIMRKTDAEKFNLLRHSLGYSVHRAYSLMASWAESVCPQVDNPRAISTCIKDDDSSCSNFDEVFKPYACEEATKSSLSKAIVEMFQPTLEAMQSESFKNELLDFVATSAGDLVAYRNEKPPTIEFKWGIVVGVGIQWGGDDLDEQKFEISIGGGQKGEFVPMNVMPKDRKKLQADLDKERQSFMVIQALVELSLAEHKLKIEPIFEYFLYPKGSGVRNEHELSLELGIGAEFEKGKADKDAKEDPFVDSATLQTIQGLYDGFLTFSQNFKNLRSDGVEQSNGKAFIRSIWAAILALRTPVTSAVTKGWGEGATNIAFKAFNAVTGFSIKSVTRVMLVAKFVWTSTDEKRLAYNKCDSELKVAITKSAEVSVGLGAPDVGGKLTGTIKSGHEVDLKGLLPDLAGPRCGSNSTESTNGGALQIAGSVDKDVVPEDENSVDNLKNDLDRLERDIKDASY